MTTYQFDEEEILVQPYSEKMGPFTFDLGPLLPTGDSISSVTVKTYDTSGVETTTDLINGTPTESGDVVTIYFDYPGSSNEGRHKITFEYETANGMKDEADFWCVRVVDI